MILKFQIPWGDLLWLSLILSIIISWIVNRLLKKRMLWGISLSIVFISVVFLLTIAYSYKKRDDITGLIEEGNIKNIAGVVTGLEKSNSATKFKLENNVFQVNYTNLYCISGKNLVKKGDYVVLKYVDLGKWMGYLPGYCIIEFKNETKKEITVIK